VSRLGEAGRGAAPAPVARASRVGDPGRVDTLAFTSGGSDEPVHTLPGGEIHTGELPPGDTAMDDDGMTMTDETGTTP